MSESVILFFQRDDGESMEEALSLEEFSKNGLQLAIDYASENDEESFFYETKYEVLWFRQSKGPHAMREASFVLGYDSLISQTYKIESQIAGILVEE